MSLCISINILRVDPWVNVLLVLHEAQIFANNLSPGACVSNFLLVPLNYEAATRTAGIIIKYA
jgi:hypothetical protein